MRAPLEEQFKELRDTWQASIEKWTEFAKAGLETGTLTPDALKEFFGPATWSGTGAFDAGLRQVLEGPQYANLWDQGRKLMELQQRALQRDKHVAAYQAVVQKAWNLAFQRFSTSFAGVKGDGPVTWRGLTDRWLKVVNDTLVEVHRSDEFLEAQRRMLRAAAEYRLQERKIAEAWCQTSHIPTRTEMDEMQRTVTELKRQVRDLQQRNAAQSAAVVAEPPAMAAAPRRPAPRAKASTQTKAPATRKKASAARTKASPTPTKAASTRRPNRRSPSA
jgi:polyhydroxyalkanoate synthesis regulator phasin